MEQATKESIYQLSDSTEQDIHPVESWQHMVATLINQEVQLDANVEPNTEQQIADPQAQNHIGLNIGRIVLDTKAHDGPSVKGHYSLSLSILINVGFEAGLPSNTIRPISRVGDLALQQNRSETICRLRILAFFSLVFHAIVGVPYLFGDFYGAHATYLVMLMITSGAIVVALISISISYWSVSDPSSERRSNWVTRLLIVNFILLGRRRAVYCTRSLKAQTILLRIDIVHVGQTVTQKLRYIRTPSEDPCSPEFILPELTESIEFRSEPFNLF